ncbi:MAG: HAMP domain-containing histidine kinase [Deltaproteobacteria bacterium]|nr:HAMP domain-containing histidine kinase [Deltaproteobacteria bacterium]
MNETEHVTKKVVSDGYPEINRIVFIATFILDAFVVLTVWDDPVRRWVTIGICVLLGSINATLIPRLYRLKKIDNNSFMLRELINGVGQAAKVVAANASLPTWGWLFVLAAVMDTKTHVWAKISLWGLLVVQVTTSIVVGVDWLQVVTLSMLTIVSITLNAGRSSELIKAVNDKEAQRRELERRAGELKQIQTLATQQEKMSSLGMLAAGIAHEINNPMAFVTSNIRQLEVDLQQLSESDDLLEEYRQEIIPEIKEGIVRVNTIVDDLRRFARGDVEFRSMFDVNDVIRSAVRMTHGRVPPGVAISLSLNDIPAQLGYPRQISQVVINLLVNAIQAVLDGGIIKLHSNHDDACWWLTVTDTGAGMDDKTRARIFEPFFTTKPLGEGTGLGLAVVHGIVEQQKGVIEVLETSEKGTTFRLMLPLRGVDAMEDTGTTEIVSSSQSGDGLPPSVVTSKSPHSD